MSVYRYLALDGSGKRVKGTVEAGSPRLARDLMRADGLTPLSVDALDANPARSVGARHAQRLRDAELTLFLRLLGGLLEAGLELEAALRSTAAESPPRLQAFHAGLLSQVLQGQNLSQALEASAAAPSTLTSAIAAGERSGRLGEVLSALAAHGERRAEMRSRVAVALLYPAILTVVSLAVALGLVSFVVPEVARVFEGYQRELPLLTRALLALSAFLNAWGLELAAVLGLALVGAWFARHQRALLDVGDWLIDRTPLLAGVRLAVQRERFLDTLAMLLGGGVALVDAMRAASGVLTLGRLKSAAAAATSEVERGSSLAGALRARELLSAVALQLVAAGEEGARLESMLARAAALERGQLERRLAILLGALEPALIVIMGALVLLIVLAVLLPIFELNTLIA